MIKGLIVIALFVTGWAANAGSYGPCKIKYLNQSDSYSKFMLVKMECVGTDLAPCTNVLTDTVTYDATTEIGKFRTSMLLSAFMAGKDVLISSWGNCPVEISNVPKVYGIIVY